MKKINIIFLASVITVAFLLSSCAGLDKMKEEASGIKYTVNPSVLVMKGGEVEASITGEFPAKFFNKAAILTVTPVIKYDGGELALDPIVLQGEAVQENNKVIPYEAGGSFTHNVKFAYKDEMKLSELVLKLEAKLKDKLLPFPDKKVADGIISTENLVKLDAQTIIMPDNFKRIIPKTQEADILYLINRAEVRSTELKAEDIKTLESFIKKAKENEKLKLNKASISAYASPDGPEDLNAKLADKRQSTAEQFIEKQFKGIEEATAAGFLSKTATAEDWDGFKKLMESSSIEDKDLILRVLSMNTDPTIREKEIKNISKAYVKIADEILPQLRRSKLSVEVNQIGHSDEEIISLASSTPDSLNIEELLFAATLVDNKLETYQKAADLFPTCVRAFNNVGVSQIEKENLDGALTSLNKAKSIKDNAIIGNNLGAVSILKGEYAEAGKTLAKATDAGKPVNYNLGIVSIKAGNYDAAINYLARTNSFNQALAMLLGGNPEAALTTLDKVENNEALVYYLKAIVGARKQDINLTMTNLKTAVQKDASLKEYVKTDVEFKRYFEDETFKTIIQ